MRRLLEAVTTIGDRRINLADRRSAIMNELASIVGADAWMWSWGRGWPKPGVTTPVVHLDFGFDDEQRGQLIRWALDAEVVESFQCRILERMGAGRQITSSREIYTPEEWEARPPFRNLMTRCGWGCWIHGVRYSAGDTWSTLLLLRSDRKGDFGPADLEVADLALEGIPWLHSGDDESLPPEAFEGLTSRQRSVLLLLLDGAPRKKIASTLSITEDTVGDHIKAIYTHFGVGSSTELAALFLKSR